MSSNSSWKFYAQRIVSGEWLDTDVQLTGCSLTYALSAINSGQLILPTPGIEPFGSDGRPVWGKWDTMFYAERDGALDWVGIADEVVPSAAGTQIKMVGLSAWLNRVDFSAIYQEWETNTFDVVRMLLDHANGKPRGLTFVYPSHDSATTVGDPEPPPKPVKPPRHKHESKSAYQGSSRYTTYLSDLGDWNTAYGDREKIKIVFWESPYVGDEITSLAGDTGFDWREQYRWVTGPRDPEFKINFADDLTSVRTDIAVEDGVNVVGRLSPSDDDESYANKVLAIGAGQGRNTRKQTSAFDDGRLYSARYLLRKHIHGMKKLQKQSDHALSKWRHLDPQIGTVNLYDVAGFSDVSSIKPGDILPVKSDYLVPHINTMAKVISKTEFPLQPGTVQIDFETQAS